MEAVRRPNKRGDETGIVMMERGELGVELSLVFLNPNKGVSQTILCPFLSDLVRQFPRHCFGLQSAP